MSINDMKSAGNLLIKFADGVAKALANRKKFKDGEDFYYVSLDGEIRCVIFNPDSTYHHNLIMSENAFKTYNEAEAHKDEIMKKYQDLRDQGLV